MSTSTDKDVSGNKQCGYQYTNIYMLMIACSGMALVLA